jgi:hypothetical protein
VSAFWLDLIEETADQAIIDSDIEELARIHYDLQRWRRALTKVAANVEERLAEVMPDKLLELPGLPVMERRRGSTRKQWDSDAVLSRVVRHSLDPEGTGEYPTDPLEAVDRVVTGIKAAAPITPSMGWRVTALRGFLDVDEFCSTEPGPIRVQVHEAAA